MRRAALYLAFGSAASIVLSIAVSQILLVLGVCALLFARTELKFPPIKLPLALLFGWTVLAALTSRDPIGGLPQIRKFMVFAIALLILSTFESLVHVRLLWLAWTGAAITSAVAAFLQFLTRRREAIELGPPFYDYYMDGRPTGLAGHWMTFGGEEMIVLLVLLAFLLFAPARKWKHLGWLCLAFIWTGLVLNLTRSIFLLGVPSGVLYLVWQWKPKALAGVPVIAAATFLIAPAHVRERMESVVRPRGVLDANGDRAIARRVGIEIIKAHPWFGIGPEQIKPQFEKWLPADTPRPLPRGWYGHLHNIYFQFAAERGIPALAFLIWMIGRIFYDFARQLRLRSVEWEARFVLHGAIAVIIAILAEGFFEHNLGDSEILTMFLIVVSCGYTACAHAESRKALQTVLFRTGEEACLTK